MRRIFSTIKHVIAHLISQFIYLLLNLLAFQILLLERQVRFIHLSIRLVRRLIFLVVVTLLYLFLLLQFLLFKQFLLLEILQLMLLLFFVFILLLWFFILRLRCSTRCLELELAISNLSALFVCCRSHDLSASEHESDLHSFVLDRLKWPPNINTQLT